MTSPVTLVVAIALVVGCTDDDKPLATRVPDLAADRSAADLAAGFTTELDTASASFGDGVLADLMGDAKAARAAFEQVLASPETPANVAARAALHLAQLLSRDGNWRDAQDLIARSEAFAPNDQAIKEGADQLRRALVSSSVTSEVRGPRPQTALPGTSDEVAAAFAAAEKLLPNVHRIRLRPVLESLYGSLRIKESATEGLIAKYQDVAEHGGLAATAARYRAGSLYHDLAMALLVVELPTELNDRVQAQRRFRGRGWMYLERAVAEYTTCLAVPATPDAELWRLAADTDFRRATALLQARGK